MDVKAGSSDAELTAPLVSPEILSSFEALSEGRCSLSNLHRSVLGACRSDPDAADGVLQLLDLYARSCEFGRFDLGPLRRALEHRLDIQDPTCDSSSHLSSDHGSEEPAAAPVAEARVLRGRYILAGRNRPRRRRHRLSCTRPQQGRSAAGAPVRRPQGPSRRALRDGRMPCMRCAASTTRRSCSLIRES